MPCELPAHFFPGVSAVLFTLIDCGESITATRQKSELSFQRCSTTKSFTELYEGLKPIE